MRRAVLGLSALLLLASSCSLGPKEDWADAIHDAYEKAARNSTAATRMAVDLKVIETNIRQTPQPLIARLEGVVNFDERRARMFAGSSSPVTIFDDLNVYLPRSSASLARHRELHWVRFDFERKPSADVDSTDRRLAVGASMISPALATEILDGVLTGSIERRGTEVVTGETTVHYHARFSQDAAVREIDDEDRKEGLTRLLETLGVQEDVFPVDVWIDGEGRARRIRFVMRQQKDRVNAFGMTQTWEFYDFGKSARLDVPKEDDSIRSRRFRAFIVEFIRQVV
jgi:hypothetical protein